MTTAAPVGEARVGPTLTPVVLLASVAAVFWFAMFSPWTHQSVPFWPMMATATAVLTAASLWVGRADLARVHRFQPSHLLIGIAGAAALYLVFWLGHRFTTAVLPFAAAQVDNVYATRAQASPMVVGLLLLLWIGPAEEVFWRGFMQDRLTRRFGARTAFFFTTAVYTLVHLWAFNLMLLTAALVCGVFWGLLYWRTRSLWPGIISHALWDATIFVVLPIQ